MEEVGRVEGSAVDPRPCPEFLEALAAKKGANLGYALSTVGESLEGGRRYARTL
jgi:hypothetical protein